jgi:hypothetical protein
VPDARLVYLEPDLDRSGAGPVDEALDPTPS